MTVPTLDQFVHCKTVGIEHYSTVQCIINTDPYNCYDCERCDHCDECVNFLNDHGQIHGDISFCCLEDCDRVHGQQARMYLVLYNLAFKEKLCGAIFTVPCCDHGEFYYEYYPRLMRPTELNGTKKSITDKLVEVETTLAVFISDVETLLQDPFFQVDVRPIKRKKLRVIDVLKTLKFARRYAINALD